MHNHLHHVHVFAANIDESIRFYQDMFEGVVILDRELVGTRNAFIRIGNGRLHLYDQPPRRPGKGSIHHFGIQTDDIVAMKARLEARGVRLEKGIADLGPWRYVMVPAPDDVWIELFEVSRDKIPPEYRDYFEWNGPEIPVRRGDGE